MSAIRRQRRCWRCDGVFVASRLFVYCTVECAQADRAAAGEMVPVEVPDAERARRQSARWAVKYAIQKGILSRGRCEQDGPTCSGPVEAHHEDYAAPLAVRWLCRGHHRKVDGWKFRRVNVQRMCNQPETERGRQPSATPLTLSTGTQLS